MEEKGAPGERRFAHWFRQRHRSAVDAELCWQQWAGDWLRNREVYAHPAGPERWVSLAHQLTVAMLHRGIRAGGDCCDRMVGLPCDQEG
jgi:hypothetical protein